MILLFDFFSLKIACPDCGQGTCTDGKSGLGKCTCKPGWVDATGKSTNAGKCDTCASGYWGNNCKGIILLKTKLFLKKSN